VSNSRDDPPAANHVYSWVRNAIANGLLVPDERYSVYWLAEKLDISRTPVREAILRLAQLGVVEVERNRGFTVRRLSVEEVRANYEARMLLEVPAARAAAQLADAALTETLYQHLRRMDELAAEANIGAYLEWDRVLHAEIVRAGGNVRIELLAGSLRDASVQTWGIFTNGTWGNTSSADKHHYAIVDAIAECAPERAARAMQGHLADTALNLMHHVAIASGEVPPEAFAGRMVTL
jgi:DNA-binding GntR family transcriptional regulator